MSRILLKAIKKDFTIELCKVNREVIGVIDKKFLNSIKRSVTEIDTLEISIPKYIYKYGEKKLNPIWYECKEERLICLNNEEYFVLKRNDFKSDEETNTFTAYSLEYKLTKFDVIFEDIVVSIFNTGLNDEEYVSLSDLLYSETGWKFGKIDRNLFFDTNENNELVEKIRIQDSVNKRWYDYITTDLMEMYGCIPIFDTYNKVIDLVDIKSFGEEIELYLSNDNYIKSLQRVGSSENLVTRLYVIGNDEMDIIGATVTGYPYIEDFSYFYNDMSEELYTQLMKYYEMVEIRNPIWKNLVDTKMKTLEILTKKKTDLYVIYEEIRAKKSILESYKANNDDVNSAIVISEITKLNDEKVILEGEIKSLEEDVVNLTSSINEINILCKKETATDENGHLIFNESTLNELKEFVYCDTYTNDSFIDVNDLIKEAKRQLELKCFPTVSYTLDLENFIVRVDKNGFNKNWLGDIGLGDVIILYDKDVEKEVFLYVNTYTQYPNSENDENELDIEISNQKLTNSDTRFISDRLKESELATRILKRKLHLLNDQKYNRINITKGQIGGTI